MTIRQSKKKLIIKKKKRRESQLDAQRNEFLENDALQLFLSDGFPIAVTFIELQSSFNFSGYAAYYLRKVFWKA